MSLRTSAHIHLATDFSSSSLLSGYDLSPESGNNNSDSSARTGPPEMQMNWLSRFLHIKPASKTLCFHIGRGRVRQDLVRLLRDWQRFGVQNVSFNRENNAISGRVDKNNRKCSPPSFPTFVFHAWQLEDHGFEVELLETETVLRCNHAFLSAFTQYKRRHTNSAHV